MKEIKVKIRFIEEALGTLPANKKVYSDFIASLAPDAATREEEIANAGVEEYAEKQVTVFARNEKGEIGMYGYQWRGFFKEACGILKKMPNTISSNITANKKLIDNYVFIKERFIPININGAIGICERPLRASTPQGDRNALAMSESVPEGSTCEFTVMLALEKTAAAKGKPAIDYAEALIEWLQYGMFKGYGQWRNSGKGRFEFDIE